MNWGVIGALAFIISTVVVPIATVTTYDEIQNTAVDLGIPSSYRTKVASVVNKTIGSESFRETIVLPTGRVTLEIRPGYYFAELLAANETVTFESDLQSESTIRFLKMSNMSCRITETPTSLVEEVWTADGYLKIEKNLGEISEYSRGNAYKLEDQLEWCVELTKSEVNRLLNITSEMGEHPSKWW